MDKFFLTGFLLLIAGSVLRHFWGNVIPAPLLSGVFLVAAILFLVGIVRRGGGPC